MTQVATHITTRQTVIVESVNGGWTTCRYEGMSQSFKVRNSQLRDHREPAIDATQAPLTAQLVIERAQVQAKAALETGEKDERRNGLVDPLYLQFYTGYKASRNDRQVRSIDNGDGIARDLRSLELPEVYRVCAKMLGVEVADLKAQYQHLNLGMQRMNLGNKMRGQLKREARANAR